MHLKPQAESLLFAAVLLLLQPMQIEEVDRVLQSVGLSVKAFSGIRLDSPCFALTNPISV